MIDIRLPMGLMFSILGLLLTTYGIFTNGGNMYMKSFGFNVNLFSGILMLILGTFMLWKAIKARKPK